jgi:hypothetical protein
MRGKRISPTEYTERQRPLSGVHSIMIEKLAQAGDGGGCTPTPSYIYHHVQSCGVRSMRVQIHSPYFYSTPICTLWFHPRQHLPLLCVHVQMYISMSTSVQYCVYIFLNLSMANDSDLIGGYMQKLLARYDSIRWVELRYTDKKENLFFFIYTEIQNGAAAKSYKRNGFIIYEGMRKYLTIYTDRN